MNPSKKAANDYKDEKSRELRKAREYLTEVVGDFLHEPMSGALFRKLSLAYGQAKYAEAEIGKANRACFLEREKERAEVLTA